MHFARTGECRRRRGRARPYDRPWPTAKPRNVPACVNASSCSITSSKIPKLSSSERPLRTRWLNLNGRVNSLTAMLGNPCCYRHRAQPDSGGGGRITPQANFFSPPAISSTNSISSWKKSGRMHRSCSATRLTASTVPAGSSTCFDTHARLRLDGKFTARFEGGLAHGKSADIFS